MRQKWGICSVECLFLEGEQLLRKGRDIAEKWTTTTRGEWKVDFGVVGEEVGESIADGAFCLGMGMVGRWWSTGGENPGEMGGMAAGNDDDEDDEGGGGGGASSPVVGPPFCPQQRMGCTFRRGIGWNGQNGRNKPPILLFGWTMDGTMRGKWAFGTAPIRLSMCLFFPFRRKLPFFNQN